MKQFSLSSPRALPDSVVENGSAFPVNTDFRVILRILRLLQDTEVLDADKHRIFLRLFFPGAVPEQPYAAFSWFVACGIPEDGDGERDFDFEQDSPEIYSAFMQIYRIDLLDCPGMHWWKFNAMLGGAFVCNTALSNKIHLRHMDDTQAKRKNDAARAKRRAEIKNYISHGDSMLEDELRRRLMNGEPIADMIRR